MATNFDPVTGQPISQPIGNAPVNNPAPTSSQPTGFVMPNQNLNPQNLNINGNNHQYYGRFAPNPNSSAPGGGNFNQKPQVFNQNPQGFNQNPQSFNQPRHNFSQPGQNFNQPGQSFNQGAPAFGQQPQSFNQPNPGFGQQAPNFNKPNPNFNPQGQSFNQGFKPNNAGSAQGMNWSTSNQQNPNELAYSNKPVKQKPQEPQKKSGKGLKIAIIAAVSVLVLGLIGGGIAFAVTHRSSGNNNSELTDDRNNNGEDINNGNQDAPDNNNGGSAQPTSSSEVVVDDLFKFEINGYTYTVPMEVSKLLDQGWVYADGDLTNEKLTSGQTMSVDFYYSSDAPYRISTTVKNYNTAALTVPECYISTINFYGSSLKSSGLDVKLFGGKVSCLTSTQDDIIAAMGEPGYTNESDASIVIGYQSENKASMVSFSFKADPTPAWTRIDNDITPSNMIEVAASNESPDYDYTAPPTFTGTFPSAQFKLDGETYELPVPLAVFENNGWEYDTDPDLEVASGKDISLGLTKDGMRVTVAASNTTDGVITLRNSVVTSVSVFKASLSSADLEFAGGFKETVTESDVKSFISSQGITNYYVSEQTHTYKLYFSEDNKNNFYSFTFNEDGSLNFMTLQYLGQ